MLNKIINTCQNFNTTLEHLNDYDNKDNTSQEELDTLQYLNLDLAKAIIQDIDPNNAKHVANIILGFVE